jgi:hypothetical protein
VLKVLFDFLVGVGGGGGGGDIKEIALFFIVYLFFKVAPAATFN